VFDLLDRLLTAGEVVLTTRPVLSPADRPRLTDRLRAAFDTHALSVAGPPLPFDAELALAAAECVSAACWFAVSHTETSEELERAVTLPDPRSPAAHLSGDVLLRFLPHLYRRSRARAADDPLTIRLADVLRRWPLSGVLSDVAEAPLTPLEFGGHHGLLLLYGERLAAHDRPAWRPAAGRAAEAFALAGGGQA
jgi:hypothetical protein